MTLAQRLLLATAFLTIAASATVGFSVREAWRRAEERRFQVEFSSALGPLLRRDLQQKLEDLPLLVEPLCAHDPLVDSALVGLTAGDLASRRLPLSLRVPELAKALGLDELLLVTHTGEVIGARADGLVGRRDPALAREITRVGSSADLRSNEPQAIVAACRRQDPDRPEIWVGLLAARHLGPTLERIGAAFGVTLALGRPPERRDTLSQQIAFPTLPGLEISAQRSRLPLVQVLRELDATILGIGLGTVAVALGVAFVLSRGLARPMVELARQAREVMRGEPRPIVADGPREIVESAAAFNHAIQDLIELRTQLAASERIAAWREIARRVAHEIKNPLAPIRAAIETLRRLHGRQDPAFDGYFDEATRTALDEVTRIDHIVSEFTRFARLPAPRPSDVDLVELARSVVALHSAGGATVRFVDEPCPTVRADRDQIVQVLTNLVKNALEACAGVPVPEVVVSVAPSGDDRVRISVRDNGPGIDPAIRERLFVPYATTKAHGTGLGLAIAQRLVVEHGGSLSFVEPASSGPPQTVPSRPPQTMQRGAEFRVELPLGGPPEPGSSEDFGSSAHKPTRTA